MRVKIIVRVRTLTHLPHLGHAGRREGTRELIVSGLPYIVVYRINEERRGDHEVEILGIVHGAQDR